MQKDKEEAIAQRDDSHRFLRDWDTKLSKEQGSDEKHHECALVGVQMAEEALAKIAKEEEEMQKELDTIVKKEETMMDDVLMSRELSRLKIS